MISFEHVTKSYRRGGAPVVNGLDLQIPEEQTTVIVGPSGCGKTTTLRMINRMLEPTSGRIVWDDVPLTSLKRSLVRRRMGYVIQGGGLFPHRTVSDNVATVPHLLKWDARRTRSRVGEVLELVGLDAALAGPSPSAPSGGQQQRAGAARALAGDPEVLLMDEPFSAVDPVVRADLQDMVRDLQQRVRKTIVLITHDIDEAVSLGDQVALMRVGGTLAQAGRPQELLDAPADDFVAAFVGRDRGYRSLGFAPAQGLRPVGVRTARALPDQPSAEPVLILDAEGRPTAWSDPNQAEVLRPLGATFAPGFGTLRQALDAALASPVGLAVAVSAETDRFAGVVPTAAVVDAVTAYRSRQAAAS